MRHFKLSFGILLCIGFYSTLQASPGAGAGTSKPFVVEMDGQGKCKCGNLVIDVTVRVTETRKEGLPKFKCEIFDTGNENNKHFSLDCFQPQWVDIHLMRIAGTGDNGFPADITIAYPYGVITEGEFMADNGFYDMTLHQMPR